MSPTQSFTPDNVSIVKRNPKLDIAEALKTEWMDNHVFATAWLNAMSITFPLGEQFLLTRCDIIAIALLTPSYSEK